MRVEYWVPYVHIPTVYVEAHFRWVGLQLGSLQRTPIRSSNGVLEQCYIMVQYAIVSGNV